MKYPPLTPAEFIRRENRFRAAVLLAGQPTVVHVPNSGRLQELLIRGARVWLVPRPGAHRMTAWDLTLVELQRTLVCVDARLPNQLYEEYVRQAPLEQPRWSRIEREVVHELSRFDLRLTDERGYMWVEVKSATLVREGVAYFPDAPTTRGRRHVLELTQLVNAGELARVVFVIGRADAQAFTPNVATDPAFSAALRQAYHLGVEICALTCQVSLSEISIDRSAPIIWS